MSKSTNILLYFSSGRTAYVEIYPHEFFSMMKYQEHRKKDLEIACLQLFPDDKLIEKADNHWYMKDQDENRK